MNALELISKIRNDGCRIMVKDTFLDIYPAEKLKPELLALLRYEKVKVLCTLHREEELKYLVYSVCAHHGFTQVRYEEALMAALSDQANALIRYAALAHEANLFQSWNLLVPTKEKHAHEKTNINKLKHVTGRLK